MKVSIHVLYCIFASIVYYTFLIFFDPTSQSLNLNVAIYVLSLSSLIIFFSLLICEWKEKKNMFHPINIFLMMLGLFNAGQFILWALGIHSKTELGKTKFISFLSADVLVKTIYLVNFGMLFLYFGIKLNRKKQFNVWLERINIKFFGDTSRLFLAAKIVSVCVLMYAVPVTLYSTFSKFGIASLYGYQYLYYGTSGTNLIFSIAKYMFLPGLLLFWVGNEYSKKAFNIISVLFFLYAVLNMMIGERGTWLKGLLVLISIYYHFYKKISFRTIIFIVLLGGIVLTLGSVLVHFREYGFSNVALEDVLNYIVEGNVLFQPIFEMGSSANVLGIIVKEKINIINTGPRNTYIPAILGMFFSSMKVFFGYPDMYLENWISQTYLGLKNYGLGFTIFAEAYFNGGDVFYPIILIMLGYLIGKILNVEISNSNNPITNFMIFSSLALLCDYTRSSLAYPLRCFAYGVLIPLGLTFIIYSMIRKDV